MLASRLRSGQVSLCSIHFQLIEESDLNFPRNFGMQARIVVGSRNRKKALELVGLLGGLGIEVATLADYPDVPDVVEDGQTFADNAAKKASEYAIATRSWVLADDSGLAVDALRGAPGVYSARYAGEDASDEDNNRKLLEELAGVLAQKRTAHYVAHIAVADPTGEIRARCEDYCHGRILTAEQGAGGFGYDPLFEIQEYHRTFGTLSPLVKSWLSHRGRALRAIVPQLARLLCESSDG